MNHQRNSRDSIGYRNLRTVRYCRTKNIPSTEVDDIYETRSQKQPQPEIEPHLCTLGTSRFKSLCLKKKKHGPSEFRIW